MTNDNYCLSSLNTSHRVGARPKIKLFYPPIKLLFCHLACCRHGFLYYFSLANYQFSIWFPAKRQKCNSVEKRTCLSLATNLRFLAIAPAISYDHTCHLGLTHLRYRLGIAIGKIGSTQSKCQSLAFQKISLSIFGKLFVHFQNALFGPLENWHFATV